MQNPSAREEAVCESHMRAGKKGVPLPKYTLALLGRVELSGRDRPIELPNKKLAGLLAYLACTTPEPQSREKLATLLWGSHFETQAQQNLRQALYRLRRALGEEALVSDRGEVRLAPGVFDCDVARFEALIGEGSPASLAAAADLYKGRLLADANILEEAWTNWVTGERRRLEGLALDALVRFGEIELAAGHPDKALATGHRALAINNLREDGHRLIVHALAAAGRRAEALRHYQNLVTLLKRELDTEPDAATNSLVAELGGMQPPRRSAAVGEIAEPALAQPDQPSIATLRFADTGANPEREGGDESPLAAPDQSSPAAAEASGSPERRQLTILVCNMVGSASFSGGLDPEDMHDLTAAFHRAIADVVARFDGFVAQYLGDGVRIYFGYPAAHELDAERAVRAGLAIVDAVGTLKAASDATLRARVGIATGLVVVGEQLRICDTRQHVAIGEAPTLAGHLQAAASPGEIVIAASTRRLVRKMFDCRALPAVEVNGQPIEAWQVRGETAGISRFEARREGALTPLAGRQEEIDLLRRRWDQAKAGEGRVVLLSGEPGIGKSRLAVALGERLAGEPNTRLRYFCSPQHTDSALSPIIGQMERAAALAHDDSPQARLDKLDAMLARTSTPIVDAALFAEMLSLPNDGRYPALELPPRQRRQKTLEAFIFQVEARTRQNPVLMIFEDAHWTDPTSLEALDRLLSRIATLRALLIVTSRPEFAPSWTGQPHVTVLTINRLAQREVGVMIDGLVGNRPLPASTRQDIIERTDGIPLFVEEMTKAVLEAESQGAAEPMTAAIPSPATVVPASLHASLMARLDRLGTAKEMAQIGAAIGREFSHALLGAVMRKPEAELAGALDRLIVAGLLFRQGMPPHATYLFKHALVQDAAYGTLLREPRRALHARIAEALESQFAEIAQSQPELLARHCTEAGLIEKASGLWGKAGQRSLERSALVEAAEQFMRALSQIEALPATPVLRREQIKLQVALLTPLIHIKGFAAPETKAAAERALLLIERAETLGEPPEDPLLLFSVLYGFWAANVLAFNGDAMRGLAAQFLALAEKQGAAIPRMVGHRLMGVSLMCTGDIAESRAHYDRAIALYDPVEHRPLATRFGNDTGVVVLGFRSWALWLLGHPAAALRDADDALDSARELGQAPTLMFALWLITIPHILCGNCSVATARLQEVFALADEKGASPWKAVAMALQGCALALTGEAAEAVHMISSGISAWRSTGSTVFAPLCLSYLATAYVDLGKFDDARRCIGEAMATTEALKETWFEAEVHRVAGEIALKSPEPDAAQAEAYFERALAVARQQSAKSLELRAAMSMARLWRDQGKRPQARDLLAQVYGWFTEGFDTHDLMEAKALLHALAW
jgi:class 3 adenylate cyclase/DNA-binding SARP family transcriptional activator/predicted ATPase